MTAAIGNNHGYNAYSKGCRCTDCREAKAAYMRGKRREATTARTQATDRYVAPGITHGTISGYKDSSCRCAECCRTKKDEDRRLYHRSQLGAVSLGVILIVTCVGLAALGCLTSKGRPNGAALAVVVVVGGILWVLGATFRGYWVQQNADADYTEGTVKTVKQNTSSAHFQDAA